MLRRSAVSNVVAQELEAGSTDAAAHAVAQEGPVVADLETILQERDACGVRANYIYILHCDRADWQGSARALLSQDRDFRGAHGARCWPPPAGAPPLVLLAPLCPSWQPCHAPPAIPLAGRLHRQPAQHQEPHHRTAGVSRGETLLCSGWCHAPLAPRNTARWPPAHSPTLPLPRRPRSQLLASPHACLCRR